MSNAAALFKGRDVRVTDGVYIERADHEEPALEAYLRDFVARFPQLRSRTKQLRSFVSLVNAFETEMQSMDTTDLRLVLRDAGAAIRREGFSDKPTARAFAAIREGSRRTLKMRHHDVQLMGGRVLLGGRIAEMETGEGKTLVATLAACSAAAAGATVHVITVNDYLADRDAKFNEPLYTYFGLRIGIVVQGMTPSQRREQYAADIVYVSNKEVVFDYLKDRLATGEGSASHYRLRRLYRMDHAPEVLLRGLHVAIVDEADSVLIDEARTPLIISETRPDDHGAPIYQKSLELARKLIRGEHFEMNARGAIWVTPKGEVLLREHTADLTGVWKSSLWRRELVEKALNAIWSYQRDQHYIVADGKVQIVDEFTGRVMPDRSWEYGLHQMIEAKEGCEITGQRSTLSRMTYQRFFRRYLLLCGMTGTATEVEPELKRVYDLSVQRIPTNRPSQRQRLPDHVWPTADARWQGVAVRAAELSRQGRAILIGTRSVEASEQLADRLTAMDIPHQILNARQDRQEAEVVAQAGQTGRITVATNMAGRGTDIRLAPDVASSGGLHVILTEYHESGRVDRQLFGRCARQGEAGSVEAMISLEDVLFVQNAPLFLQLVRTTMRGRTRTPAWLMRVLVRFAQRVAEYRSARVRMATLKQDRKLQRALAFSGKPT